MSNDSQERGSTAQSHSSTIGGRIKQILYIAFVMMFALVGCHDEQIPISSKESESVQPLGKGAKVTICHRTGNGSFVALEVSVNALPAHLAHGDYVADADGDGYTAVGACVGSADDCNDNDATINPGAVEVCGDGLDNNCNGQIDEGCGPDFQTFYIRNNNSVPLPQRISPPWDTDIVVMENAGGDGYTFGTPRGGQKVGYGTSFFDGIKINTVETVNWTAVGGMTGGIITYLNFWVTDGTNYAVISSENQYPGTNFATRQEWKVFEYAGTDLSWLFPSGTGARDGSQYLTLNGVRVTLAQLGNNIILKDPGVPYPSYVGTGAPRGGYGFNLIWGDTQTNFAGNGGQIANLSVTVAGVTYLAANY